MQLLSFRVTEFRSVDDSGWIEADDVTALIGTNEAGKTNVLVPLRKLKPAKNGAIEPLADYPRKRYNEIRALKKKPIFIHAKFELTSPHLHEVAKLLKVTEDKAKEAIISRDFDGKYYVDFPKAGQEPSVATGAVAAELESAQKDVASAKAVEGEETILAAITEALTQAAALLDEEEDDTLPYAVLDSDEAGRKFADSLKSGLYSGDKERVKLIGEFVSVPEAEVEDFFPPALIARVVDRYLTKPSGVDEDFVDVVQPGKAIVSQIEAYAAKHGITLDEGWKVDVSRRVKTSILKAKEDPLAGAPEHVEAWPKLFRVILSVAVEV
jgi:ABC-type cobalamin/Fe3+-siderophores transport system ATPase subunit